MPFDVAERYMQAAEEALGISLPASYRLAMMRRNGGFIATENDDWDLYPIADESDRRRLARTLNGVVPETERARTWHGFPSTAVALGGNGGGDKLVFIMGGGCLRPEVFIWRHETGELLRVADDFGRLVPSGS